MRVEWVKWNHPIGTGALAVLFCLGAPARERAQAATDAQSDIYANFVGVWVGTDKYLEKGREVAVPERVIIVESKKKDSMKWKYEDGIKGSKGHDLYSRQMMLNPVDSEMTLVWENSESDRLKTIDLDAFARTGLGAFSAAKTMVDDAKASIWILKFDLQQDTLRYGWFRSDDGKNFTVTDSAILRRERAPFQTP